MCPNIGWHCPGLVYGSLHIFMIICTHFSSKKCRLHFSSEKCCQHFVSTRVHTIIIILRVVSPKNISCDPITLSNDYWIYVPYYNAILPCVCVVFGILMVLCMHISSWKCCQHFTFKECGHISHIIIVVYSKINCSFKLFLDFWYIYSYYLVVQIGTELYILIHISNLLLSSFECIFPMTSQNYSLLFVP